MTDDRLDLDDPTLWNMIHHGSASLVESVAIDLVAEVRVLREQVATLTAGIGEHRDEQLAMGDGESPNDRRLWSLIASPDDQQEG